jgi:hypothetical protein
MLAKLCELGYLRPVFLGGTWRRFRAEDVEEVIRGTALRAEIVIADPRARRPLTGAALVQHQRRLAREAAEAGEAPAP